MKTSPINSRLPVLWHGGDYNPDQWPAETLEDDVQKMQKAGVNVVSLGVFSWSQLEPEEGLYTFDWMERAFDLLGKAGIHVALATPTSAPPRWMTLRYPQVLATGEDGQKLPHGERQRFAPLNPTWRDFVRRMNTELAKRFGQRENLVLWHVSNEYVSRDWGEEMVQGFRRWLRERYGDLDTLNQQWWSAFWSHRFTDWKQIIPPAPRCNRIPEGLILDWKRWQSQAMLDFFKFEVSILREITPDVPVTNNLMGRFPGLDYAKFADVMDVISWDCYGNTHGDPVNMAFDHALMRGMKPGKPWLLIEQTPSATNWQGHATLKPPGMLSLWSWQAIGHGSDSVMYFQWRRSRGAPEKFHGAVVEHAGREDARVFQETAALGGEMKKLSEQVIGTLPTQARIGILADQECRWALEQAAGYAQDKNYYNFVVEHFRAWWKQNYRVDVVQMHHDWSQYDVLIAPALYMTKTGQFPLKGDREELAARVNVVEKLSQFVEQGGCLVGTFLTGIVNESDLVFETGYPGPLKDVFGIWVEETDCQPAEKHPNTIEWKQNDAAGALKQGQCDRYFDQIHLEGAAAHATYGQYWYAGKPVVTCNRYGKGSAWYIGTQAERDWLEAFYAQLARERGIQPMLADTPDCVEVLERTRDDKRYLFLLNHSMEQVSVDLGAVSGTNLMTGEAVSGQLELQSFGKAVIEISA